MNLKASRSVKPGSRTGLFRFGQFMVLAVLFLLFAGAAVKTTESGLAVPDWPLSFGQLMPPMEGGVFYEHGHRMVATGVGFLTLVLAAWLWMREPRQWLRRLGLGAVALVIVQGVLGGITVLMKLPLLVSASHAVIAQTFFLTIVFITLALSKSWNETPRTYATVPTKLPAIATATTILIVVQLILGAIVRHMEAALVIPDFPLAFGRIVPPSFTTEIAVHYAHRVGAVVVLGMVAATVYSALSLPKTHRTLVARPAVLALVLVLAQVLMGAMIIWTARHMHPTNTHLVLGASLLATCMVITARSWRFFAQPKHQPATQKLSQVTS